MGALFFFIGNHLLVSYMTENRWRGLSLFPDPGIEARASSIICKPSTT
jgi:hypothetical protein